MRSLRERGRRDAELTLRSGRRLKVAMAHVGVGMKGLRVVGSLLSRCGRTRDGNAVGLVCVIVRRRTRGMERREPVEEPGLGGGGPAGMSMSSSESLSEESSEPGGGPAGRAMSSSSSPDSATRCQLLATSAKGNKAKLTLLALVENHRNRLECCHLLRRRSCTGASASLVRPSALDSRFSLYGIPGGGAPKGLNTGS